MKNVFLTTFLWLMLALIGPSANADLININFAFSPTLVGGTDPHGLANATWSFHYVAGPDYGSGLFVGTPSPSGTLNIAGSTDVDGTYTITGPFAHLPNVGNFGTANVGIDADLTNAEFIFAGISVARFTAVGNAVVSQPPSLSPVLASHFDGIVLRTADFLSPAFGGPFRVLSNSDIGEFTFSGATVSATAVPEPSSFFLMGLVTIGAVSARRRARRQRAARR